jgi:hypothetical protein
VLDALELALSVALDVFADASPVGVGLVEVAVGVGVGVTVAVLDCVGPLGDVVSVFGAAGVDESDESSDGLGEPLSCVGATSSDCGEGAVSDDVVSVVRTDDGHRM